LIDERVELIESGTDDVAEEFESEVKLFQTCDVPFDLDVFRLIQSSPTFVMTLLESYIERRTQSVSARERDVI
jgi:hypothetical protein